MFFFPLVVIIGRVPSKRREEEEVRLRPAFSGQVDKESRQGEGPNNRDRCRECHWHGCGGGRACTPGVALAVCVSVSPCLVAERRRGPSGCRPRGHAGMQGGSLI